jgi:hypothetical protein
MLLGVYNNPKWYWFILIQLCACKGSYKPGGYNVSKGQLPEFFVCGKSSNNLVEKDQKMILIKMRMIVRELIC